jgi:glycine oxidase
VVPRGDGRVVIGATSEERDFDAAPTLEAALRLLHAASALEPELARATLHHWRTGLRPVTRDGLPVIGALEENVFVATGHGRNGVLLAPATAELVANALCDGNDAPEEFSPHRFLCVSH